jgi:hypothetical protein
MSKIKMLQMKVAGVLYNGRNVSCIEFINEDDMNKFLALKQNLIYEFLMCFDYGEKEFWYVTKEKFLSDSWVANV